MQRVMVAGASGQLGRHVVDELKRKGFRVRALTRSPARLASGAADEVARGDLADPASLAAACAGVDAVVSCAGASMDMAAFRDRRSFFAVDWRGNRNLLDAAKAAGVRRFVYVSLHGGRAMMDTEYAAAHERFVDHLARSGVSHTVVRPTGFFSFLGEIGKMARKGRGVVIGDGGARTNPIHEADLAEVVVSALESEEAEIPVGGPEVLTRREIVEAAFRAAGRQGKIVRVPPAVFRAAAALMRPINPRVAALLAFGARVSVVDCVAPAHGTRRLEDYFREIGGAGG